MSPLRVRSRIQSKSAAKAKAKAKAKGKAKANAAAVVLEINSSPVAQRGRGAGKAAGKATGKAQAKGKAKSKLAKALQDADEMKAFVMGGFAANDPEPDSDVTPVMKKPGAKVKEYPDSRMDRNKQNAFAAKEKEGDVDGTISEMV